MTFIERLNKLEQMDQLIRLRATGNSKAFARKIDVSESSLFRLLNDLKELGAEIEYNAYKKTYFYCGEQNLRIGFEFLEKKERKQLRGGKKMSDCQNLGVIKINIVMGRTKTDERMICCPIKRQKIMTRQTY